jgi:hypothetical protein
MPTVTGMHPSNSFMDGSVIDSFLPIFSILITALRAIIQCGELQTLVPTVPEERASPMCTLLFSCMLFQFFFVRFFFKPSLLLFVFLLLVAFLFLLTLPLVKENACSPLPGTLAVGVLDRQPTKGSTRGRWTWPRRDR